MLIHLSMGSSFRSLAHRLRILGSMAFNFSMGVTEGPEVVFFKDYFGYNQGPGAENSVRK